MKTNLSGIVQGLSNEDYHAHSALSSTGLKELAKSPAHFRAYITEPREQTEAMKFGTGFHELVGEPGLFAKKYVKGPQKAEFKNLLVTIDDMMAKIKSLNPEAKVSRKKPEVVKLMLELDPKAEIWDLIVENFERTNAGRTILTSEQYDQLDGMLTSILKHKTALSLLTDGMAEQSIFWEDPETGVSCKCRPDYLRKDGIVVDLKTTDDASPQGFQRSLANYAYHLQSAFYLEGVSHVFRKPLDEFVHLVVEKKPPYGVALYSLDEQSLKKAREQIKTLLALHAECSVIGEWPAYSPDVQSISLPAWMVR